MTVTVERDDNVKVIALEGKLQANNADNIREEIVGLIDKKPMIISLEKCTYVSSAGLRALLMIAKTAKSRGVRFICAAMIEDVEDIFNMTGFINMLKCVATIADAEKLVISC